MQPALRGRSDQVLRALGPNPGLHTHSIVDNALRVLQAVVFTELGDNTTAVCASYCQSLGPQYAFASVEYSVEYHCGTGWKEGVVAPSAPTYDCTCLATETLQTRTVAVDPSVEILSVMRLDDIAIEDLFCLCDGAPAEPSD